jgi:hypothetical protein
LPGRICCLASAIGYNVKVQPEFATELPMQKSNQRLDVFIGEITSGEPSAMTV